MEKDQKIQMAGEVQNEALEIYRICDGPEKDLKDRLNYLDDYIQEFLRKLGE